MVFTYMPTCSLNISSKCMNVCIYLKWMEQEKKCGIVLKIEMVRLLMYHHEKQTTCSSLFFCVVYFFLCIFCPILDSKNQYSSSILSRNNKCKYTNTSAHTHSFFTNNFS